MDVTTTHVLLVGSGALVGFAAGALVGRAYFEKKYQELSDAAIAEVKAVYTAPKSEPEPDDSYDEVVEETSVEEDPESTFEDIANEYNEALPEPETFDDPWEIITDDQYTDNRELTQPLYESEEGIMWFPKDDVVCDKNFMIIDDPESLLGPYFRDYFDLLDDEGMALNPILYIRNHSLKVDFEVFCEEGQFVDAASAT